MPAADYRILTDATGQRIAAALEALPSTVKSKTETITFDANGNGQTSLSRSNTILFLACDTSDWYTFGVFGNNFLNAWVVICNELKNASHTVVLYYFDV